MNDDTMLKHNIILIVLIVAALGIGWWVRGCTVDGEVRSRIETAPQTVNNYHIEKPVPKPQLPAVMKPAKPRIKTVIDTTAINSAIDSMSHLYGDTLSTLRELLRVRSYEYGDSTFYILLHAMTPLPPVIDSMWIPSVKCDSVVVTKFVPVEPDTPWYDHWWIGAIGMGLTMYGASQL